jgi:hypothetical protein
MRTITISPHQFVADRKLRPQVWGCNRNEFYVSLALFVVMNVLYYSTKASFFPPITTLQSLFFVLLFRPGLDIVCGVCALSGLRDKENMTGGERTFCGLWFGFLCLWNLVVLNDFLSVGTCSPPVLL